jgi:hypothetical protein
MFVNISGGDPKVEHLKGTANVRTRLERLSRDKHSSLLRSLANYDRKKFYNIGPGCVFAKLLTKILITE